MGVLLFLQIRRRWSQHPVSPGRINKGGGGHLSEIVSTLSLSHHSLHPIISSHLFLSPFSCVVEMNPPKAKKKQSEKKRQKEKKKTPHHIIIRTKKEQHHNNEKKTA